MTMSDPIADMLTRIRNANTAKHDTVDVPASKMKIAIESPNQVFVYTQARMSFRRFLVDLVSQSFPQTKALSLTKRLVSFRLVARYLHSYGSPYRAVI